MSNSAQVDRAFDVAARVRTIIADALNRPADQIALDAKLESALGIDSMTMIEIGVSIEEQFGIALPADLAAEVQAETVGDLVRVVEAQLTSPKRRA